jgi:hypothetical protein
MARDSHCPACNNAVDLGATVCSNASCRAPLAFCSHCRDVTTYTLLESRQGRLHRDRYRCDRCQGEGVKCLTWLSGGYCNGLARGAAGAVGKALCATCTGRVGEMGRTVLSMSLVGALGGLLKPKK